MVRFGVPIFLRLGMMEASRSSEARPTPAALFQTSRDRDATATIRGFVYQVDVTLLRWLNLNPGEHLELECGEDIDHVREVLSGDESSPERIFEAIKNRGTRLTLRSEEALEALADFYEHGAKNPDISLCFRYITNCEVGREKAAVDETGAAGVEIWEQIRTSRYSQDRAEHAVAALRNNLRKARKPSKLNEETWKAFGGFLASATAEQFRDFIMSFEWSTRNTAATDMRDVVIDSIRLRRGGDQTNERLYYEHLFAVVFSLLSRPGPRVLDERFLNEALAEVRPDIESEAIIVRIRRMEEHLTNRLDKIAGALADQGPKLDQIVSAVIMLSRQGREAPEFAPEVALMLDAPPAETRLCSPGNSLTILPQSSSRASG
jgi:hypothetical protein